MRILGGGVEAYAGHRNRGWEKGGGIAKGAGVRDDQVDGDEVQTS